MTEKIIISGFGGQGIMFLGKLLALAAMRQGMFVTFLPAYGAEVRGGASYCSVIISDKEIASPCVEKADTLIAMNAPSLEKFSSWTREGADVFANSSMLNGVKKIKSLKWHLIPFTDIALKLGNVKSANMAALGAYLGAKESIKRTAKIAKKVTAEGDFLACKESIPLENIFKLLPEFLKNNKELIELNKKAIEEGLKNGKS